MDQPGYAIGQAIFIRTDTLNYEEETVSFHSLEEMVATCSKIHENLVLEKVVIFSMIGSEPCSLTLGFISASKGQRPHKLSVEGVP